MYTQVCELLQIKHPIIQAGMAGGITTPQLVAAVSNAGGLGTIGAGYLTPNETRKVIREVRDLTDHPFAVNLFRVEKAYGDSRTVKVKKALSNVYNELGIHMTADEPVVEDYYEEQFNVLLDEEVPVISTTFGVPTHNQVIAAQQKKLKVMTMVTTVEEAIQAELAGVDAIIAQGGEAGGHRGTFKAEQGAASIGTFALVPQIVDRVKIPVIASGGIMDGRGLIAALALGAGGIQLGTRFLNSIESGANPLYKKALLESNEESTVITTAFSGRPARAIRNAFIDLFDSNSNFISPLRYPIQNLVTKEIRKAAKQQGKSEYMSLWAGQGNRLIKEGQSAGQILAEILLEASQIKHSL
ncbi:NAD(P)H-dependent flavin oxidoreductase [Pseudalkalibacillus berkeleyi]|uniref:Probable nitronate monooxygenase n=1 Tax=Pseudalkalibacillus berkeleyi TaxID=1069813 RepID=A0ABS9H3G7_9BACL|nr:nitronate monooxygenase [Pseudalkalibacillus berkeleyi]MCF6138408.1 nitronate monooxygenase [Pseudalkalibacillus berkeleyi]